MSKDKNKGEKSIENSGKWFIHGHKHRKEDHLLSLRNTTR